MDALGGAAHEAFDRSIDVHVSKLRAKLEKDPRAPRYIKTVRGVGYALDPSRPGPMRLHSRVYLHSLGVLIVVGCRHQPGLRARRSRRAVPGDGRANGPPRGGAGGRAARRRDGAGSPARRAASHARRGRRHPRSRRARCGLGRRAHGAAATRRAGGGAGGPGGHPWAPDPVRAGASARRHGCRGRDGRGVVVTAARAAALAAPAADGRGGAAGGRRRHAAARPPVVAPAGAPDRGRPPAGWRRPRRARCLAGWPAPLVAPLVARRRDRPADARVQRDGRAGRATGARPEGAAGQRLARAALAADPHPDGARPAARATPPPRRVWATSSATWPSWSD